MAGHSNDPVGHVHEILSYQETVARVKAQVVEMNKAGNPTMLISVSDHETGGLSLGYQLPGVAYPIYAWYPDALVNGTSTSVKVAQAIHAQANTTDTETLRTILGDRLGVSDPDSDELAGIMRDKDINDAGLWTLDHTLSKLTSKRAQVGWSTEGHSGVDGQLGCTIFSLLAYACLWIIVNLYGYPRTLVAPYLGGSRENTEVRIFLSLNVGCSKSYI